MTAPQVGVPVQYRDNNGDIWPGLVLSINNSNNNVQSIVYYNSNTPGWLVAGSVNGHRDDTLSSNNTWSPVTVEVASTANFEDPS